MAYELKGNVMSANRIKKMCKELITECKDDKARALDAFEFFETRATGETPDRDAQRCMVECLKISQSSKGDVIKLMGMLMKFELAKAPKQNKKSSYDNELGFEDLEELDLDD